MDLVTVTCSVSACCNILNCCSCICLWFQLILLVICRRKFRLQMSQYFPVLQEDEVSKLVPLKEDVSTMKLYCSKGESVLAYTVSQIICQVNNIEDYKFINIDWIIVSWYMRRVLLYWFYNLLLYLGTPYIHTIHHINIFFLNCIIFNYILELFVLFRYWASLGCLCQSCGTPVAFSVECRRGSVLLPSLYMCWAYSGLHLAPVFSTHPDVLARLQQGADLMMPGVIYSGQVSTH